VSKAMIDDEQTSVMYKVTIDNATLTCPIYLENSCQ